MPRAHAPTRAGHICTQVAEAVPIREEPLCRVLSIDHRSLLELLRRTEHLVNVPSPIGEEGAAATPQASSYQLTEPDALAWTKLREHFMSRVTAAGGVDAAGDPINPLQVMRTPSVLDLSDGNLAVAVHELAIALNEVGARSGAGGRAGKRMTLSGITLARTQVQLSPITWTDRDLLLVFNVAEKRLAA